MRPTVRFQSLLDEPNPNSPANSLAAQLYQENRREYEKRVQQIVEQSWLNFADADPAERAQKTDDEPSGSGSASDTAAAEASQNNAVGRP